MAIWRKDEKMYTALMDLMEAGVKVYFFQGNHDIWCYHYFSDMGLRGAILSFRQQEEARGAGGGEIRHRDNDLRHRGRR